MGASLRGKGQVSKLVNRVLKRSRALRLSAVSCFFPSSAAGSQRARRSIHFLSEETSESRPCLKLLLSSIHHEKRRSKRNFVALGVFDVIPHELKLGDLCACGRVSPAQDTNQT